MMIRQVISLFKEKPWFKSALVLIAILSLPYAAAIAGDGIEWERFRFMPSLTLSGAHSSNVYQVATAETDDFITAVIPEFSLDFAVVPKNFFSLKYRGEFQSYSDSSNFREDHHRGSLSFNSETAKGSRFVVGVSLEDTAVQPDSLTDQAQDYVLQSAFAEVLLMLGSVTEIGAEYAYDDREFDESINDDDEYTRIQWDLSAVYRYSAVLPILLQYRFIDQDNNDTGASITDFRSHTVFVGGRWRPANKLSGALRVGYTWAEFDDSGGDDFDGYAIDTNLVYDFSEITQFVLEVERAIRQRTQSANDLGDYFVFTTADLTLVHRRWERITTRINFFYQDRDYTDIQGSVTVREDEQFGAGLSVEWAMRSWISFSLGYRYRDNDSDVDTEDYTENLVTFGITLSL